MKEAPEPIGRDAGLPVALLAIGQHDFPLARTPCPTPYDSNTKEHLAVPLLVPSRPTSPGSLSILSTDEWQTLNEAKWTLQSPGLWRTKLRAFWVRNLGLFYMLIAQLFGTAMTAAARYLELYGNEGKGFHPFQVLFARMGITAVLATSYMFWHKTPHFPLGEPRVRWLLFLRGFAGFFGIFGMYYSLTVLPISDAVVLTFLAPGLSLWACSIFIGSAFSRVDMLGTFVSLIGVIFIAKPTSLFSVGTSNTAAAHPHSPDAVLGTGSNATAGLEPHEESGVDGPPRDRVLAVGIALIGVIGTAVVFTTLRAIGKRAHPLISVNYFAIWCTIICVVMQAAVPSIGFLLPGTLKEWMLLLLLGLCGFIMQFLLVIGLAYEKGSRATNMAYTSMLFALASDKMFFGITPGISSIIGSTIILSAAIVMAMQKTPPTVEEKAPDTTMIDEERGLAQHMDGEGRGDDDTMTEAVPLRTLR